MPDRPGWWWVWSADDRAIGGWLPVWVYSMPSGLGFWQDCRGGHVSVDGYMWGGPVERREDVNVERAFVTMTHRVAQTLRGEVERRGETAGG